MVFIAKWPLSGGYSVLFNQGRQCEMWPLFTGEEAFNTGLTVHDKFDF